MDAILKEWVALVVEEEPSGYGDPVTAEDTRDLVQIVLRLFAVDVGEHRVRDHQ